MSTNMPMYFILDRDRIVDYQGNECVVNHYQCSCCGIVVMQQCMTINFCSTCGVRFEDFEDRSM